LGPCPDRLPIPSVAATLVAVYREGTLSREFTTVANRPYLSVAELARGLGSTERLGIEWVGGGDAPVEYFRVAPGSDHLGRGDDFLALGSQDDWLPVIDVRPGECALLCYTPNT